MTLIGVHLCSSVVPFLVRCRASHPPDFQAARELVGQPLIVYIRGSFDMLAGTVPRAAAAPAVRGSLRAVRAARCASMALLLAAVLVGSGCGGDFLLIINTGTVVANADCRDGGGSFELRESGGLTVLVVITSDTTIVFAGGGAAACADIIANTAVSVRGTEGDGTIRADRIRLGGVVTAGALARRGRAVQDASTSRTSTSAPSV